MANSENSPQAHAVARRTRPASAPYARRRLLTIYAILALGVLAFPGGLVGWLDERNASGWFAAPLAFARGIDAVSGAIGVKEVGQGLRKRFSALIGEDEG